MKPDDRYRNPLLSEFGSVTCKTCSLRFCGCLFYIDSSVMMSGDPNIKPWIHYEVKVTDVFKYQNRIKIEPLRPCLNDIGAFDGIFFRQTGITRDGNKIQRITNGDVQKKSQ